jgi:hypothetical protein
MRKFSILSLFVFLFAFASLISVPKAHAGFWVDELGDCSSTYMQNGNDLWYLYTNGFITYSEWNDAIDQEASNYTTCLQPVSVPALELDFCSEANLVNQDCIYKAQSLDFNDDLGFAMACREKSGIDLCQ